MTIACPTRRTLRPALLSLAVATVLLAGAAPAEAHVDGEAIGPTNYQSEITDPGTPGLSWQVITRNSSVELTNASGAQVTVLGYQGEPYLRFAPDGGVYRNANSPATYLNEHRYGGAEIPPGASPSADPDWEQVDTGNTFAWQDHRAHWMSRTDPPQVATNPGREHSVAAFAIPLVVDDRSTIRSVAARGELRWLPDIAWWPPIIILTGAFVAIVAVVAGATLPSHDRWTSLARAVTGIILVVLTANFVRAIDDLTTHPGRSERAVIVITSLVAFAAISALCVRGWRGHPGGFAALAGAAMLITGLLGTGTFGELSAPQLDTSLPDWLRRWTIAATFTAVAPALLAAVLAGRWVGRTQSSADPATPPAAAAPPPIPASRP